MRYVDHAPKNRDPSCPDRTPRRRQTLGRIRFAAAHSPARWDNFSFLGRKPAPILSGKSAWPACAMGHLYRNVWDNITFLYAHWQPHNVR
jgi:hypothetical protein